MLALREVPQLQHVAERRQAPARSRRRLQHLDRRLERGRVGVVGVVDDPDPGQLEQLHAAVLAALELREDPGALFQRDAPLLVGTVRDQANDRSAGLEAEDVMTIVARPENHRRIVTGIHVLEHVRRRIVLRVEEGGIPVRRGAFVDESVQVHHHVRQIGHAAQRLAVQVRTEGGHQQCRGDALAGDVADGNPQLGVGQGDEIVVVAADLQRRLALREEGVARDLGQVPGQKAERHLLGQGQVAQHALPGHPLVV